MFMRKGSFLCTLTNDLVVAVPYGNTKNGADVEVRELVCLKKSGSVNTIFSENYHPSAEKISSHSSLNGTLVLALSINRTVCIIETFFYLTNTTSGFRKM